MPNDLWNSDINILLDELARCGNRAVLEAVIKTRNRMKNRDLEEEAIHQDALDSLMDPWGDS